MAQTYPKGDGRSLARTVTLLGSILVALAAGTNYVYSAYAPQLSHKLHISHTQLNIIGLAGNIGVYSTGPLFGYMVDTRGPRILFANAIIFLAIGYLGIRSFYDGYFTMPDVSSHTFTPGLVILALFSFATGYGGCAGITASMNVTAKSFPDKTRGTVTGLVVSGFGLSAFFFSTLAHEVFPGNTSDFLLFLALGTSLPMVIGFFFVKPVLAEDGTRSIHKGNEDGGGAYAIISNQPPPSPSRRRSSDFELRRSEDGENPFGFDQHPRPPRTSRSRESQDHHPHHIYDLDRTPSSFELPAADFGAASPGTIQPPHYLHGHDLDHIEEATLRDEHDRDDISEQAVSISSSFEAAEQVDIHGRALFATIDFWLLFTIVSLLSGTGLMWINNVGSITQALLAKIDPNWEENSPQLQAAQVSIISMANCVGRILIGLLADITKHKYAIPRATWLTLISFIFILSQLFALSVQDPIDLWRPSVLLGLAYGAMFGIGPVLALEWFGLARFSQNWGFVAVAPVVGANVFSLIFGNNLDAHAGKGAPQVRGLPIDSDKEHQCYEGRVCYAGSLKMTVVACSLALVLSVIAAWRHRKSVAPAGPGRVQIVVETVTERDNEGDALLSTNH